MAHTLDTPLRPPQLAVLGPQRAVTHGGAARAHVERHVCVRGEVEGRVHVGRGGARYEHERLVLAHGHLELELARQPAVVHRLGFRLEHDLAQVVVEQQPQVCAHLIRPRRHARRRGRRGAGPHAEHRQLHLRQQARRQRAVLRVRGGAARGLGSHALRRQLQKHTDGDDARRAAAGERLRLRLRRLQQLQCGCGVRLWRLPLRAVHRQ
eukprot:scaffold84899_cov63-Phaeocystis_antarctica.AAC.3